MRYKKKTFQDMCLRITDTVPEAKSPNASWDLPLLLTNTHFYATNVVLSAQKKEPGWDVSIWSVGMANENIAASMGWFSISPYKKVRIFNEENHLNAEIGSRSWIKRSWNYNPDPINPSSTVLVRQQRKYETHWLGFVVSSRK